MYDRIEKMLPLVFIVISLIFGIIGYSREGGGNPLRVLFKAVAGPVVFDHRTHLESYDLKCNECHHDLDGGAIDWQCRNCHSNKDERNNINCGIDQVHKFCIGVNCVDCHKKMGREDECASCH